MHGHFVSLKRGLFLKIWPFGRLILQLKLVYSIVEHPKLQLQRVDGVVGVPKLRTQLVFCHFQGLLLPWKQNIYAISTLKWHKKPVAGLVLISKRGKFLVEVVVSIPKWGKFLKLSSVSVPENVRQQESCPV